MKPWQIVVGLVVVVAVAAGFAYYRYNQAQDGQGTLADALWWAKWRLQNPGQDLPLGPGPLGGTRAGVNGDHYVYQ